MVGALGGEGVGYMVMSGRWVVTFVALSGSEQTVAEKNVGQVMEILLTSGFKVRYGRVNRGCW